MGALVFPDEKVLAHVIIEVIPRQNFVIGTAPAGIEVGRKSLFLQRLIPSLGAEMLGPALQNGSLLPDAFHYIAESAVTSRKNRLDSAELGVVIIDGDLAAPNGIEKELLLPLEPSPRLLR